MIIMGIDPGYAIVGVGLIECENSKFKVLNYGVITTDSEDRTSLRLRIVFEKLCAIINKYKPDYMSVEKLYFNDNHKTALTVSEARGVILLAAEINNIPICEYTPLQIKQATTGYGRAPKAQMQRMVTSILNLNSIPKPDDAADALAVALCHAYSHKFKEAERRKD